MKARNISLLKIWNVGWKKMRPGQTTSDAPHNKEAVTQARLKLLRTTYTLAMNPTMPLKQFKTLVKVQTDSGVQLIDGHHDHRSAKTYVSRVAEAVAEKCAGVFLVNTS